MSFGSYGRRELKSWRDIMQVCLNGHVINTGFKKYPQHNKEYCNKCGEKTITQCPNCEAPIPGDMQDTGVAVIGFKRTAPDHCESCGEPFSWKTGEKEKNVDNDELSKRVFIVHGHDTGLKNELARILNKLELEPIILHEQPDSGKTIFSKLEGEMSDVGFAFVLLTPDDLGTVASKPDDLQSRARQNVVFEHGLFVGYLGPSRVCAIVKNEIEIPSDLHGVLYKKIPNGGNIQSIGLEIVKELKAAGYNVDANKL